MAVEIIIMLGIFGALVLIAIGLSLLSQSYRALDYSDYNLSQDSYYKNPLVRLGSLYYHWRPKGAVVVSKKQWETIESNIALKLSMAERDGITKGRARLMQEIRDKIAQRREESDFPKNPYLILGITSNTNDAGVEEAYRKALDLYGSHNFTQYDKSFRDLAALRRKQIKKAYQSIIAEVAPPEGGQSISKGTF